MKKKKIVTSEYVSYGHPDKVADQISDALLDGYLSTDSQSRVGIETMIKDNIIVIGGEVNCNCEIDVEGITRNVLYDVNYPESHRLGYNDVKIIDLIGKQSHEISKGVDKNDGDNTIGAGDQGFVVGYASNETKVCLPLGVYLARQICNGVTKIDGLGPDVKTQVSVEYGGRKAIVKSIVVSSMHSEELPVEEVRNLIQGMIDSNRVGNDNVMDDEPHLEYVKNKPIKYYLNENGTWNIGGPISDCGMTGRKIVVDSYGGYCNVGGGCFSGKDMSKVDRSGAYMARYLAKNIVDAGIAAEAKVTLSYVISKPEPYSVDIELNGEKDSNISDLSNQVKLYIEKNIDLTPNGLICRFFGESGTSPIFYNTAKNGHFGFNDNNQDYPWEKTDISGDIADYIEDVEISLGEN